MDSSTAVDRPSSPWPYSATYSVFVRSFADSNGDGIGDLEGLRQHLPYFQSLGVEALWLSPIHPSPSYHKYDVTDHYGIHPEYGDIPTFKALVAAAHQAGIRIILDLVINHSSFQHPWFREALQGKNNPYREYYKWKPVEEPESQSPDGPWHPVSKLSPEIKSDPQDQEEWYLGVFWHGMPDLNFAHPPVTEELYAITRFWLLEMKVDGFRLDAAKFIFDEKSSEANIQWWAGFSQYLQQIKPDVMLIGEVWDSPDYLAPYFRGLPALFNFDLAGHISTCLKHGRDTPQLIRQLKGIREKYSKENPDFIDGIFLSNHDLPRIRSQLKGSIRKCKAAANLLFTLPGAPFIYYGEELGMLGEKPDEYIREPFPWQNNAQAPMCTWLQPRYSLPGKVSPYVFQQGQPNSLFHHYRRLIELRKTYPQLHEGELTEATLDIHKGNPRSLIAFFRSQRSESLLVLHNISGRVLEVLIPEAFPRILFCSSPRTRKKELVLTLPTFSCVILSPPAGL